MFHEFTSLTSSYIYIYIYIYNNTPGGPGEAAAAPLFRQNAGNGNSETLDLEYFRGGGHAPGPPRISHAVDARPPHFSKASAGPE